MRNLTRAVALAAALATLLVTAATASAATAPGYEEFSDCPSKNVDSTIGGCVKTVVSGGHLQMGTKTTPITDPISLSIGIDGNQQTVVGDFDGGRQRIPGGLVGITGLDWLTLLFPLDLLQVYAEPELAGPVVNPTGPIGLPLKVRLDNPLLSDNCYIGSNDDPIDLTLRGGTTNPPPPNQPISGQPGTFGPDPSLPGVFRITDLVLVDNEFAAPAARGCDMVGLGLIDSVVNLQAGLPSPAGTNETVQHADIAISQIAPIYPPSGFEQ